MQSEKNETINEKGLLEIVNIWISENPDHFGTAKKDYRPAHISRCMRYLHAPDEYLIKKLEVLPDLIKWHFQILQLILFTGLAASATYLMKSAYDTLILTLKEGKSFQLNWYFFFGLILPILISFTMVFIREKIVRWVQYGFLIKQNLNEIDIEMYIITKILELRKNN